MSYMEKKIITVTPAGRRQYLKILHKYLLANRDIIDEHHWWINTNNQDDIAEIENICAKYPDFFKQVRGSDSPNQDNLISTVGQFYKFCQNPDTIYIKIDDDIVWIAPDAVKNLIQTKIENPQYFFVAANIINNAVCNLVHEKIGALPSIDGNLDPLSVSAWRNGDFAYKVHKNFIKLRNQNRLDKYKFPLWIMWDKRRFSINTICFSGEDMKSINGNIPIWDDEEYISSILPVLIKRYNAICGKALVSHFSFWPQLEFMQKTNMLELYDQLSNKELEKIEGGYIYHDNDTYLMNEETDNWKNISLAPEEKENNCLIEMPDNFKDILLTPEEKDKALSEMIDIEYNLGEIYFHKKAIEKAIESYKKCLIILCNNNFDISNIDNDYRLNIKDKIKKIKIKIAEYYTDFANGFFEYEDYETAMNFYKKSIPFNPDCFLTFHNLGICFDQLHNNSDSAILYLNKALELNTNYDETYRILGDIYYNKEDFLNSVDNYEKYIEIEKDNPNVYNRLGHIYMARLGLLEKGFEYFKTANKIAPDNFIILKNLLYTAINMPNYNQIDYNNLYKTVIDKHLKAANFKINNNVKFDNTLDKNRKIHIGLFSDFIWINTPEIKTTRQFLKHYNRDKFKISCYSGISTDPHPSAVITKSYIDNYKK